MLSYLEGFGYFGLQNRILDGEIYMWTTPCAWKPETSMKNVENYRVEIVFFSQGRDGLIKAWLLLVKHSEGRGDQISIDPICVVENGSLAYCKIFVCRHLNLGNAVYIASPSGKDGPLAMYKFVDNKFLF